MSAHYLQKQAEGGEAKQVARTIGGAVLRDGDGVVGGRDDAAIADAPLAAGARVRAVLHQRRRDARNGHRAFVEHLRAHVHICS